MNLRIANKMCEDRAVFWDPQEVWDWQSTWGSNRAGWFVQASTTYEKNRGVILVARSLHQDEHHRQGETWMTSEKGSSMHSIRNIHAFHK